CVRCVVHGEMLSHSSRQCARKLCSCRKCELVNRRRAIKSLLDKLRRRHKANRVFESVNDSPYTCLRCRHHGVMASKRFHSPCPFSLCRCKSCDLIEERTLIEKELTQLQRREKNPGAETFIESPKSTQTIHVMKKPSPRRWMIRVQKLPLTRTIQQQSRAFFLILDLITALSEDPKSPTC
ncbi:hypothetical protein PRIPAC_95811, partial [Pristionchus pacificus]|uniref:DM domain-containing protein n=1 Tax=Pristionchus pacificus TaxID=54126 RepID=A0A2A6B3B6_PRIPA